MSTGWSITWSLQQKIISQIRRKTHESHRQCLRARAWLRACVRACMSDSLSASLYATEEFMLGEIRQTHKKTSMLFDCTDTLSLEHPNPQKGDRGCQELQRGKGGRTP